MIGRVGDRDTFTALRRHGLRGRSGPVSVRFLPEPGVGGPRLAFAIGRKVGPAVVRNRIRRQLRHAAADLARARPGALAAGAYLVQVDPAVISSTYATLASDLAAAVAQAARRVR